MPDIDQKAAAGNKPIVNGIQAGASIKMREPSQEASPSTEETTSVAKIQTSSIVSEPQTATMAAPVEVEKEDDYTSGSSKARKLGESRRKLASTLLDAAQRSEAARSEFKNLVDQDKELEKYFKKHFPKQYTKALNESSGTEEPLNEEAVAQRTRAEVLSEELREEKDEAALELAVHLKFTQSEAKTLKILADRLEGIELDENGKQIEIDYEEALKRAARIIRPDKARAGITALPASRGENNDEQTKVNAQHDKLVDSYRDITRIRRDPTEMRKSLEKVEQGYDKENRKFVMPL